VPTNLPVIPEASEKWLKWAKSIEAVQVMKTNQGNDLVPAPWNTSPDLTAVYYLMTADGPDIEEFLLQLVQERIKRGLGFPAHVVGVIDMSEEAGYFPGENLADAPPNGDVGPIFDLWSRN
jgi:hypothetical protein